jgi:hypothetical protein
MKYCPNPDCPGQPKPGVRPEFIDEAVVCSDCGTPLLYAALPPEAEGANPAPDEADAEDAGTLEEVGDPELPEDWVVLDRNVLGVEAAVARGLLEAEGIGVSAYPPRPNSSFPGLPGFPRSARLFVHAPDLERARQVLAAARAEAAATPARPEDESGAGAVPVADTVVETNLTFEGAREVNEVLEAGGCTLVEFEHDPAHAPIGIFSRSGERLRARVPAADAARARRLLVEARASAGDETA